MNSLRDILNFMSKCANFVNSYLKEYLIKRQFYYSVLKNSQN